MGGTPTLSLSDGAVATYDAAASDPANGTLVFDYTAASNEYTTDLTVLRVNLNGATIQDANGANSNFSAASNYELGLDVNAAVVTNVTTSPQTGEVGGGQTVTLTLDMSGPVTVDTTGGTPSLDLSDGAVATYDAAASNPSAGLLAFDYTVGAEDRSP